MRCPLHERKQDQLEAIRRLEGREIGDVNYILEKLRLERRALELSPAGAAREGARADARRQEQEL